MRGRALLIAAFAATLAGGCAKAQARSEPELPALDVPPAPPRIIAPLESQPLPRAAMPVGDETPSQPRTQRARPPRAEARPGDATRLEPTRTSETPVEAVRAETAETPGAAAPLLTVQPGGDGALERTIRDTLARATSDLGRVDYGGLGSEAKAQYDTAKRFVEQGQDALKSKNYVFAANLADKAAVLAAVLLGR